MPSTPQRRHPPSWAGAGKAAFLLDEHDPFQIGSWNRHPQNAMFDRSYTSMPLSAKRLRLRTLGSWLAAGLILLAGTARADAETDSACKLRIGEEWVSLTASSMQSCLKYAAVAATPGEAQLAEFRAVPLAYRDGQYFMSPDAGQSWAQLSLQTVDTPIQSLNSLQLASPEAPQAEDLAAEPMPATAAASEDDPVAALLESLAQRSSTAADEPAGETASEVVAIDAEALPAEVAVVTQEEAGTEVAADESADAQSCQLTASDSWVLVPLAALEACTDKLLEQVGSESMQQHAYFAVRRAGKPAQPSRQDLQELDRLKLKAAVSQAGHESLKAPQAAVAEIGQR